MPRKVCLSIGVSNVATVGNAGARFAYLRGAYVAAETIGQWALYSGFDPANVQVITDRDPADGGIGPVTKARVRDAVTALFPAGADEVDHFLVCFCGHGITDGGLRSAFWLFSDALQENYKVSVDGFADELQTYGLKRLTLISDACRDAPGHIELLRLESRRVLRPGPAGKVNSPMADRLSACQDGQKAYMVSEKFSALPGKCILSGVVLDVLTGREPDAIDRGQIDTARFGTVSRARTTERANSYDLKLFPECSVDPTPAIMFDHATPTVGAAPVLQPWPDRALVAPQGELEPDPFGNAIPLGIQADWLALIKSDKGVRNLALGRNFGVSHPDMELEPTFSGLSKNATTMVGNLVALNEFKTNKPDESAVAIWAREQIRTTRRALEGEVAKASKLGLARSIRAQFAQLQLPVDADGGNLVVSGGNVAAIWTNENVHVIDRIGPRRFRIEMPYAQSGCLVVVEFKGGLWTPVYLYRDLFAVVARRRGAIAALAYGEFYDERQRTFATSASVIYDLVSGQIDRVEKIAAGIRAGKHTNPVLGAIAAHLYRSLSDVDNIRRIAWYYAYNGQAVPFDVALLGDMDIFQGDDGRLTVEIPEVKEKADQASRHLPDYTRTFTPRAEAPLAGFCPWLSIGWEYPPREGKAEELMANLASLREDLIRPSSFSAFGNGSLVPASWGLVRRPV